MTSQRRTAKRQESAIEKDDRFTREVVRDPQMVRQLNRLYRETVKNKEEK